MQKYLLTSTLTFFFLGQAISQSINPQILWATYFGSQGEDWAGCVETDLDNNIYITSTVKNGAPTTAGVHQTTYGGGVSDVMLSKFDKNGALLWSTYFGGSGEDINYFPISLLSDGGIVITGTTSSTSKIATNGVHDTTYGGGTSDIYLAVFEPTGKLRWSSYFGGEEIDGEPGIAVDKSDNIYLVGYTLSKLYISTANSFQPASKGSYEGFCAKFDKNGRLIWSTYYGGVGSDAFYSVAIDSEDNLYLGGDMNSAQLATAGSFKQNYGGNGDGLLVKFNKDGERIWATYFGSGGLDEIYYVKADHQDNIYIMGLTTSKSGIASSGAYSSQNAGEEDIFLAKFNAKGERIWSTFIGGEGLDTTYGCDFDKDNNIYLAIMTQSLSFPITENVPSIYYNGGTWDAVFVKFSKDGELKWSTYLGGDGNDRAIGITLDSELNIIASVNSDSKGLATAGAYSEGPGSRDALLVKMKDATIVNTQELEKLSPLHVYPNPTTSIIYIPNLNHGNRNIIVYNSSGEMVIRYINTEKIEFDISSLPNGQYFIVAETPEKISVAKVIKVE
jgi:hypothetical protein